MQMKWNLHDIPDLTGKTAIVTGGNSGIGYHTVLELARKGASVWMAVRSLERGNASLKQIQALVPNAEVRVVELDLSDLASIRAFAAAFLAENRPLDILVNNAGVMAIPKRETTPDGFEMQVGTNHLGHFALTGLLVPALKTASSARVVTVSSLAAKSVRSLDDYMGEQRYAPFDSYAKSKVSNLLFAFEMARRFRNTSIQSIAVHPSVSATNLFKTGSGLMKKLLPALLGRFALPAGQGALPTLFAATSPLARSGGFYAPVYKRNPPFPVLEVKPFGISEDPHLAATLWEKTEAWTGVSVQAAGGMA
jgi:NAD(P)-dependent dehydrogenase (short-subunit alcohol dehydrogenase family)